MRCWLLIALMCGCSSGGEGGASTPRTLLPTAPGADLGSGVDNGSGIERGDGGTFSPCMRAEDCARGLCTRNATSSSKSPGFCLSVCSQPLLPGTTSLTVGPCAKGEQCVPLQGAGICLQPCLTDADCPQGDTKMSCDKLSSSSGGPAGSWCQPRGLDAE